MSNSLLVSLDTVSTASWIDSYEFSIKNFLWVFYIFGSSTLNFYRVEGLREHWLICYAFVYQRHQLGEVAT